MGFIKKISNVLHSRGCSYLFFILSVCAFVFLDSAKWAYGWIAAFYPLGDKFVPAMLGVISACIAVTFIYLLIAAIAGDKLKSNGVNFYMTEHWEKIADQTVAFAQKYDIDGVDIDWEYPQTASDWKIYDSFIQKLKADLNAVKEGSIVSTALSAGQLGLSKETYDSIDQIQFMAYDDNDTDGYQSSLQQAEDGIKAFVDNGCDLSKINIGIAAYGRPINTTPYWATWRDLKDANYWNSKYYTVEDADQIYEGTFCAPALAGDKTAYALFSGAGGVMVFRVGCDKTMDDPNSVANGIENTLNRYVTNW